MAGIGSNHQKEIDVHVQDQVTPPFHYYLMDEQKTDITLTAPVAVDATVINVSAGHGFTTAHHIVIVEGDNYIQAKVVSVNVNAITIDTLVSVAFTVAAVVIRGSIEMAIDPTPGYKDFSCIVRLMTTPIDIQTAKIVIVSAGEPDDSLFGDIAALTNGLFFRTTGVANQNLGNYKDNGCFKEFGASIEYTDKGGGGKHSTEILFDMKKVFGIVIRLTPAGTVCFFARVRDALDGLTKVRVSIMGQFTEGE